MRDAGRPRRDAERIGLGSVSSYRSGPPGNGPARRKSPDRVKIVLDFLFLFLVVVEVVEVVLLVVEVVLLVDVDVVDLGEVVLLVQLVLLVVEFFVEVVVLVVEVVVLVVEVVVLLELLLLDVVGMAGDQGEVPRVEQGGAPSFASSGMAVSLLQTVPHQVGPWAE